jgi:hypothetical protein
MHWNLIKKKKIVSLSSQNFDYRLSNFFHAVARGKLKSVREPFKFEWSTIKITMQLHLYTQIGIKKTIDGCVSFQSRHPDTINSDRRSSKQNFTRLRS